MIYRLFILPRAQKSLERIPLDIYEIDDNKKIIIILDIDHRKDIYR